MLSAFLVALVVPVQPQVSMSAGASVQVNVPTVQFEAAPPLVEVEPGLVVVPDLDREVFFSGGYYFCNLNGAWYRTHSHHGGWARVATARVPIVIVRAPRGKFRHVHSGTWIRRGTPRLVAVTTNKPHPKKVHAKKAHAKKAIARAVKKPKKAKKASAKKTRAARAKPRKLRSTHRTSARRHRTH